MADQSMVDKAMAMPTTGDMPRRLRTMADILDGALPPVGAQHAAQFRETADLVEAYEQCLKVFRDE